MSQQATRRGLSLLVPLTLAGGQTSRQPHPAEARADPLQYSTGSTIVLPPRNTHGEGTTICTTEGCLDSPSGSSSLVPRETTDAATRVIFSSLRQGGNSSNNASSSSSPPTASARRLECLERVVSNAASDPEVQLNVSRRLARDPHYHQLLAGSGGGSPPALAAAAAAAAVAAQHHHASAFSSPVGSPTSRRPKCLLPMPASPPSCDVRSRKNFSIAVNCSVCLLPLTDAHVLDCGEGHVFCASCIHKIVHDAHRRGGSSNPMSGSTEGWTFFSWLSYFFFGPSASPVRNDASAPPRVARHKLCPECRHPFTTSIPVRKINDIVESARQLLPSEFQEDDFVEQAQPSQRTRAGGKKGAWGLEEEEEALPSSSSSAVGGEMPAWLFSLVCFVVVVAFAIQK